MWLRHFVLCWVYSGHCTVGSPFHRKLLWRKFSVSPTVPVEIIPVYLANFFFDIGVMASVVLHKRRLFSPLGCKEKIIVFVFLVTRVMCSHPNLLCKSFQSSFLSLGTAFDLFLTSFLCYTISCLSLLNVLIDVLFSAQNPSVLYCSHFTYCLSYSAPQCEKYNASPCVTAHTLGSCGALLVFLLLLFRCCGLQKQKGCQNWWSLDHPFLCIKIQIHLLSVLLSFCLIKVYLTSSFQDLPANPFSLDNVCVDPLVLLVCKRSLSCSTICSSSYIKIPPVLHKRSAAFHCCLSAVLGFLPISTLSTSFKFFPFSGFSLTKKLFSSVPCLSYWTPWKG